MIIIVFGLPGSGKSFFASKLAGKLKIKYVNSDVIRKELFAKRLYSPEEKMQVYNEMIREMKAAVQSQQSVILDATYYKKSIRQKVIESALDLDEKIIFIEVTAEEKIAKERLAKERPYSEADYSVYLKLKKEFEPLENDHLVLESGRDNIEEMLSEAMTYIENHH